MQKALKIKGLTVGILKPNDGRGKNDTGPEAIWSNGNSDNPGSAGPI